MMVVVVMMVMMSGQALASLRGKVEGLDAVLKDRLDYEAASARIHRIAVATNALSDALERRTAATDAVRGRPWEAHRGGVGVG